MIKQSTIFYVGNSIVVGPRSLCTIVLDIGHVPSTTNSTVVLNLQMINTL